ncbi:hypothetical protein M3Y94_00059600 [Aphelenchoides besseyi]|nr:hypothetical protein M3Y94_00059600 [Aphelenchoides besseyi]KAI6237959.1 hypothetical protein M3Y95_00320000 [Aphelenchoides besseyi]
MAAWISTSNKFNKSSGIYDFNFRANVLQASSPIVIIDETNIVKNAKFGLVYLGSNSSAAGRLPSRAIGVIGLGRLMNLGNNVTNYMDNMINGTGRIVLCNRPAHKRATLVLNEDYFSQEDINQWGIATMLNSENRIKPTAFEFNLTTIGVGTNYTLSNASITATLTTLSNYVTVDNQTWEIIKKELQLSNVSNSDDVRVDCSRAQPLRLFFGVKQPNGTIGEMMIVGSELIQKISANECKLMVRPFNGTAWIFGGPFLRHYCVQIDLTKRQIMFLNNARLFPWKSDDYAQPIGQSIFIARITTTLPTNQTTTTTSPPTVEVRTTTRKQSETTTIGDRFWIGK